MDPVRAATLVALACAILVVCAWRLGVATADAEWAARSARRPAPGRFEPAANHNGRHYSRI